MSGDRTGLPKFRSEYETQLSEWLKTGYKGDINASIRRSETEARMPCQWERL